MDFTFAAHVKAKNKRTKKLQIFKANIFRLLRNRIEVKQIILPLPLPLPRPPRPLPRMLGDPSDFRRTNQYILENKKMSSKEA